MLTLVHESNHFIRRYNQQGKLKILGSTGENFKNVKNKTVSEGGENMFFELFHDKKMEKLNIFKVLFILDESNWKKDYSSFKNLFLTKILNANFKDVIDEAVKQDIIISIGLNKEDFVVEEELIKKQIIFSSKDKISSNNNVMKLGRCYLSLKRETNPDFNF